MTAMRFPNSHLRKTAPTRPMPSRRGSVLVVVLALLAALMLLGFLFFTSASQERENARYFAASEKFYDFDPDATPFDLALEQIILGAPNNLPNSALWGGRHSLLANLVGTDIVPYNGTGVNIADLGVVTSDPSNLGVLTALDSVGNIHSRAAELTNVHMGEWQASNAAVPLPFFNGGIFPEPDVGYTYPDLNSLFISYDGRVPQPVPGDPKVVIPSFHRPQYLRSAFPPAGTWETKEWYTLAATLPYVMRPHTGRMVRYVDETSDLIVTAMPPATPMPIPRFHPDFWNTDPLVDDPLKVKTILQENYWDGSMATEFDVDADNDGTKEAILMDLDYPVEESADGSQMYIPLIGVTIRDLDSLLNLNATGNLYGIPDTLTDLPTNLFISRSNEGRHRHEMNPQWGFTAPASDHPDLTTLPPIFGNMGTPTSIQLANIEFWFTLVGKVETSGGTVTKSTLGRWGEKARLENAALAGYTVAGAYPGPGRTGHDDSTTADGQRGMRFADNSGIFTNVVQFLAPGHLEDHQGQGTFVGTDGRQRHLVELNGALGARLNVPAYVNYWFPSAMHNTNPDVPALAAIWARYAVNVNFSNLVTLANRGIHLLESTNTIGLLIDNPGETILGSSHADPYDSIYGPGETAAIHMSDTDFSNANMSSRLMDLVPANFKDLSRRQRFTTYSVDLKSYSYPLDPDPNFRRAWEFGGNPATVGARPANVFPPYTQDLDGNVVDLFRHEVRQILRQTQSPRGSSGSGNFWKGLARKLSVNQVAAQQKLTDPTTEKEAFMLRPLTPHPTPDTNTALGGAKLSADAIPDLGRFGQRDLVAPKTWEINTPEMQEWHARRDRQNLARDIYTLLYLTSHPNPSIDPTTLSNAKDAMTGIRPIYSDAQLREMAQFAVNMVDAMDADDTITLFVYDKDLAGMDSDGEYGYTFRDDGYHQRPPFVNNLDDYTFDAASNNPGYYEDEDRGLVFGVEAQQLAFNEILTVLSKTYNDSDDDPSTPGDGEDHPATHWNDNAARDWVFAELQNLTPGDVRLDGGWSIVIEPTATSGATLPPTAAPRSMTIRDNSAASAGATYTIGVAGDNHLGATTPSELQVDPAGGSAYEVIVPSVTPSGLDFDGILADNSEVNVNLYDPEKPWDDQAAVDPDAIPAEPDTTGPYTTATAWLDLGTQEERNGINEGEIELTFKLRRRVNLHREFPDQDDASTPDADRRRDNPWVEVDSWKVPLRVIDLTANPDIATVLSEKLISSKREEPLNRSLVHADETFRNTDDVTKLNSLGGYHSEELEEAHRAEIWQRHFDRSFASLADLLLVPLYGPSELTKQITTSSSQPAVNDRRSIAAARFLFPDADPRDLNSPELPEPQIAKQGNLWYRLFEFVEVPDNYGNPGFLPWFADDAGVSRWHSGTQIQPSLERFGKVNINMLRHPHTLAGMIDDERVISPNSLFANGKQLLSTNGEQLADGSQRDWWAAFLFSRDGGLDPLTGLTLPGIPSANPFRSFSVAPPLPTGNLTTDRQAIQNAFSKTLLRTLPGDNQTFAAPEVADPGRRALFQLGHHGGASGFGGLGSDFSTRYRMLGKMLNFSTLRSNAYIIFLTSDYYDAIQPDPTGLPDVYQIGEKIPVDVANPDMVRHRGVFIVDRAKALELLEAPHLPSENELVPGYQTFSFARYEDETPKFDWRELILYSKITTPE